MDVVVGADGPHEAVGEALGGLMTDPAAPRPRVAEAKVVEQVATQLNAGRCEWIVLWNRRIWEVLGHAPEVSVQSRLGCASQQERDHPSLKTANQMRRGLSASKVRV